MENVLTHENFSSHLNTEFQVEGESGQIQLFLMEISNLKKTERQEQFSIIFRGPLDHPLEQGLHRFEHDQMGKFELFIVPIKRNEEGYQYEAVFNRLTDNDRRHS